MVSGFRRIRQLQKAEQYRRFGSIQKRCVRRRFKNFGYALDSASDEKTRTGIDKVIKSFLAILSSLGVEQIDVKVGDDFDESVMEAVLDFPCEEGEKPSTVKQILKKGYKSGDKVIRFCQVAVTVE